MQTRTYVPSFRMSSEEEKQQQQLLAFQKKQARILKGTTFPPKGLRSAEHALAFASSVPEHEIGAVGVLPSPPPFPAADRPESTTMSPSPNPMDGREPFGGSAISPGGANDNPTAIPRKHGEMGTPPNDSRRIRLVSRDIQRSPSEIARLHELDSLRNRTNSVLYDIDSLENISNSREGHMTELLATSFRDPGAAAAAAAGPVLSATTTANPAALSTTASTSSSSSSSSPTASALTSSPGDSPAMRIEVDRY